MVRHRLVCRRPATLHCSCRKSTRKECRLAFVRRRALSSPRTHCLGHIKVRLSRLYLTIDIGGCSDRLCIEVDHPRRAASIHVVANYWRSARFPRQIDAMLRPSWRVCTPLLRIGGRRCFAKKALGVGHGPQNSFWTVGAELKADPRSHESEHCKNEHQRFDGFGRRSHWISRIWLGSGLPLLLGKDCPICESSTAAIRLLTRDAQ